MFHDTVKSISKLQDSLAILKLIAQGGKNIEENKVRPFRESFSFIRKKISENKSFVKK